MKRNLSVIFAIIIWFSVIAQFYLMICNRTQLVSETIIRFFSFFTILTNTIAAIYFSGLFTYKLQFRKPGVLTAITVYIIIVGIIYQVLLRHIWDPTGLQKIVDELLHSVNPILVIMFWILYEDKKAIKYTQISYWLIYPALYLVFVLIRGNYSGFYPYPFINMNELGSSKTMVNILFLILFFITTSVFFVFTGKFIPRKAV